MEVSYTAQCRSHDDLEEVVHVSRASGPRLSEWTTCSFVLFVLLFSVSVLRARVRTCVADRMIEAQFVQRVKSVPRSGRTERTNVT